MAKYSILEYLQTTQNPFVWNLDSFKLDYKHRDTTDWLQIKEGVISNDYHRFCVDLTLSYQLARRSCYNNAKLQLSKSKEILLKSENRLLKLYQPALKHIFYSTEAYITQLSEDSAQTLELITKSIPSLELMGKDQQSALWATRANVAQYYSKDGTMTSLEYAKEALELNDLEPEWHTLISMILMRIRHFSSKILPPSEEEIGHLKNGLNLERTPYLTVFLARLYLDFVSAYKLLYFEDASKIYYWDKIKEYEKEAYNKFMETIELNTQKCPHVMIRCAWGLHKLSKGCDPVIVDLMNEAMEKAPKSSLVMFYSGIICKKIKKYEEAQKYLKESLDRSCLPAAFWLIAVEIILDPQYSPESLFKRLVNDFNGDSINLTRIYANNVMYQLFKMRNFISALKIFSESLQHNPIIDEYKSVLPIWLDIKKPVNVLELFANDTQYLLQHKKKFYLPTELEILEGVYTSLKQIVPEIVASKEKPTFSMHTQILDTGIPQPHNSRRHRATETVETIRNDWRNSDVDKIHTDDATVDSKQILNGASVSASNSWRRRDTETVEMGRKSKWLNSGEDKMHRDSVTANYEQILNGGNVDPQQFETQTTGSWRRPPFSSRPRCWGRRPIPSHPLRHNSTDHGNGSASNENCARKSRKKISLDELIDIVGKLK